MKFAQKKSEQLRTLKRIGGVVRKVRENEIMKMKSAGAEERRRGRGGEGDRGGEEEPREGRKERKQEEERRR